MGVTLAIAGATAAVANGMQQQNAQKKAATATKEAAQQNAISADEATNNANKKKPDLANIMFGNKQGISQTNLTGPAGAPIGGSLLGSNTLLGM